MASVKHVNLYYVGQELPATVRVSAKGMSFVVPPPGESLHVPFYIARDLMRRNKVGGHSVFTTDAAMVKKLMAAHRAQPAEPRKLSREELLEMLNDLDSEIEEDTKAAAKAARATKKEEGV